MQKRYVLLLVLFLISCANQYREPAPFTSPLFDNEGLIREAQSTCERSGGWWNTALDSPCDEDGTCCECPVGKKLQGNVCSAPARPAPPSPYPSIAISQRSCETTRGTWANNTCTCHPVDKLNGLSCTFDWDKVDRDLVYKNLTAYCAQFSGAPTDRYCPGYCKIGFDNACLPDLAWEPALIRRGQINESLIYTNRSAYCTQFNETECSWRSGHCQFTKFACERKITSEEQACIGDRGNWTEFNSGCAGYCMPERKPGEIYGCTANMMWSCDCGSGKCWTGRDCVGIRS